MGVGGPYQGCGCSRRRSSEAVTNQGVYNKVGRGQRNVNVAPADGYAHVPCDLKLMGWDIAQLPS